MPVKNMRRLKIAVSIVLVAGILYFLDVRALLDRLGEIRLPYVVLAFLLVIVNRLLMPLKWNLLLRAAGTRLSHFEAVRVYTISSFLGLALPPTIGADSVRSYYLKQNGVKLSDAVASIAIERVFGLLVLLAFTIGGYVLLLRLQRDGAIDIKTMATILGVLSVTALAALYASFSPQLQGLAERFAERLETSRMSKAATGIASLVEAYQQYSRRKRVLLVFSILTVVELTIVIVRSYVVALSLGAEVPLVVFFAFLPLVTLLNRLPISFDGFGINEALFIYFLALFGVAHETGFLVGLVNHLLFIAGVLPGGLFYIFSTRKPASSTPMA